MSGHALAKWSVTMYRNGRSRWAEIRIQQALDAELENIQAFEDGLRAVEMLQREGVRVAVCSNLAAPYAAPIKRLYPNLDAYGFSFQLGMMKPDKRIYRATCELAGARADDYFGSDRVLMIGDSPKCDKAGARAAGVRGFLLNRIGVGDFKSLIEFAEAILEENSKNM
ncbi:HAD-IA family hydrolase [Pseudomonas sp. 10C3]|uniref:HAD family hydrolase n=1 Tax=Pseudomonas sp. 10C3 TaxID=3118753 RepID=UPI002E803FB2|nr:HAD-IA family hydrolase [Pseudomonas sp. 10C3]MEE3508283.1 HAD-IA family hydrolase [Pseudomonas sp. 10C3]